MDYINGLLGKKDEVKPIKIYKEDVRPKSAYAIGVIGKTIYVALLYREEIKGKDVYTKKVHTLKTNTQERNLFSKKIFLYVLIRF